MSTQSHPEGTKEADTVPSYHGTQGGPLTREKSDQHSQSSQEIKKEPWGLRWRASVWFITSVVGLGITTDLLVYSILIPVFPFKLEAEGYEGVSALVGYLLFAYSGGLVLSTPPIAWASERYKSRQIPLIAGLLALAGSQIMLMEAPSYWVMALARALQGISSSVVWIVALALLCDTTPEKYVGRQLGLAMTGLTLGLLLGPPVGGALFSRFGFRGPCIFGVIVTMVDLVGRLLIIERKDAIRYGFDPALVLEKNDAETQAESSAVEEIHAPINDAQDRVALSPLAVIAKLGKSPRALAAFFVTLIWGAVYAGQEPVITLHLQDLWGLNSSKVGLVFIAAVVPSLFSSPVAGWWGDRNGAEWVMVFCLVASLPWWGLAIIQTSLVFFIACFALENFFTAAIVAPLMSELAAVARGIPGLGYAHVYGAFNLIFGVGSAMYKHLSQGWLALSILSLVLLAISVVLSFLYIGERPIFERMMERIRGEGTITLAPEAIQSSTQQRDDAEHD
ncbi:MFS general substrate transporter [Peniophora sp. CONT]|nr:MFS general substrate transporter [Peniophora sp. CONT]